MAGIGIILNPHSKKHKQDPDQMERMAFVVGDKGSCKETSDLDDLRRVAEEFKTRDIEILGIGGGDGTNHVTLSTFIKVYGQKPLPKIAFLRGGTLNTLANACGIKGSSEKIISNILYKYHEDRPFQIKEIDLMKINDSYGFIFGTGVLFRFMQIYYEKHPSPLRAGLLLGHSILSALFNTQFSRDLFLRYPATVTLDGTPWPFKNYSAIYAGSVSQLGFNFRVFHYSEEVGKFHAAAFSMPPRSVIRHIPQMYLGRPSECEDLIESAATEMKIEFESPQGYLIDGDMMEPAREIIVSTGPRLQIIVE